MTAPLTLPWAGWACAQLAGFGPVEAWLAGVSVMRWASPVTEALPAGIGLGAGAATVGLALWASASVRAAVRDWGRLRTLRERVDEDLIVADMRSRR